MPAKKPTVYKSIVIGTLSFPIDMLRYDAAWPASEHDSGLIEDSIRHDTEGEVEIAIYSPRPLTAGRWASFGWAVRPTPAVY